MTKKLLALIFAILMVATLFAGCGDKDEKGSAFPGGNIINVDPLVGTWVGEEDGTTMTFTFNGNGTGKVSMMGLDLDMTYTTSGNTLTYTIEFMGESETQTLEYSINGNEMVLTDGEFPVTFIKQ